MLWKVYWFVIVLTIKIFRKWFYISEVLSSYTTDILSSDIFWYTMDYSTNL